MKHRLNKYYIVPLGTDGRVLPMKKLFALLLAASMMASLAACGSSSSSESNELYVGTEAGFAPYEYMSGDQVVGVDMDIAQAIADKMGKTLVIKNMDFEKYFALAEPKLKEGIKNENIDLKKVAALLQKRLETLNDIPGLVDFFDELPEYSTELYIHKKMKTTEEIALSSLKACVPVLENITDWNETVIHDTLMALVTELGIKNGQLLWPVRTALSGKPTSPGGAMELADILGKEESLRRIEKGIELLSK